MGISETLEKNRKQVGKTLLRGRAGLIIVPYVLFFISLKTKSLIRSSYAISIKTVTSETCLTENDISTEPNLCVVSSIS